MAVAACVAAAATAGCDAERKASPKALAPRAASARIVTAPAGPRARAGARNQIAVGRELGQRIVTGYHGTRPTDSVLRAVRDGTVGGVILFGENVPTLAAARSAIAALRQAAAEGHQPYLLVMIDQEGGRVKRLPSLPPDLSPAQMGAAPDPAITATAQGLATGRALRSVGVNVDLAPVADVPVGSSSFLGTRTFSRVPRIVASGACAFAAGLGRTGVAATLKHFPGLGQAPGNTDLMPVRVTASTGQVRTALGAYRLCGRSMQMVMISSASYPALGIVDPASLDPQTYRILASLGFTGITITDEFDTPAIANEHRPALAALKAGVDLLLYGPDESGARRAYAKLLGDARSGALSAAGLAATATRILAFKRRLKAGLSS